MTLLSTSRVLERSSLAGLVAVLAAGPAAAQSQLAAEPAVVPHEEFALAYLSAHGLSADDDPEFIDLEQLISAEYVSLDVGLYDLRFPIEDEKDTPGPGE